MKFSRGYGSRICQENLKDIFFGFSRGWILFKNRRAEINIRSITYAGCIDGFFKGTPLEKTDNSKKCGKNGKKCGEHGYRESKSLNSWIMMPPGGKPMS
jgi:hypothetical protein